MARNKHLTSQLLHCDLCSFSSKNLYIYKRHRIRCRKEHGLTKGKKGETTSDGNKEEKQLPGPSVDLVQAASNDEAHCSGPELPSPETNGDAQKNTPNSATCKPMPTVQRNYSCTKCDLKTSRSRVFLFHMVEEHDCKFSIYACQECEYCSKYRHKLQRHVKIAHKIEVPYEDIVAEYEHEEKKKSPTVVKKVKPKASVKTGGKLMIRFPKAQGSKTSEMLNRGNKSPSGKLPAVRSSDQLSRVMEEIVGEDGNMTFKCRECPFVNTDMQKVAKHMVSWHVDIKHFNCTKCGYICFERNDFLTHRLTHRSEHQYRCEDCTYSTDFRPNFDRHLNNHKGSYPFNCSFCSYGCGSEPAIRRHMAVNHERLENTAKTKLKFPLPKSQLGGVVQDSIYTDQSQQSTDNESDHSGIFKPSAKSLVGSSRKKLPAPSARPKSLSPVRKLPPNITVFVGHKDGRLVCPACNQKGYARSSDLNRHMKRKHACKLREYLESMVDLPVEAPLDGGDQDDSIVSGTEEEDNGEDTADMNTEENDEDDVTGLDDIDMAEIDNTQIEVHDVEEEDFAVAEPETSHESVTIPDRLLKCKYCDFTNKFPSKLIRHVGIHALEKQFKCSYCSKTYPLIRDAKIHMKKYHNKLPSLVKLVKVPTGARKKITPSKYKCPVCPFSSAWKAEVDRHKKTHKGDKKFQCSQCAYESYLRGDVRNHMIKIHPEIMVQGEPKEKVIFMKNGNSLNGGEPSQSEDSMMYDTSMDRLSEHRTPDSSPSKGNSSHESSPDITLAEFIQRERSMSLSPVKELGGGQYRCQHCGFESSTPSKMNNHLETHTNLKRYKCALCGRRSNFKWDIVKHLKAYHNDTGTEVIKLTKEEAESTIQAYLEANPSAHREHHMNTPEEVYFKCSLCNYVADKKSSVNRHIAQRVHEGEQATVLAIKDVKPKASDRQQAVTPTKPAQRLVASEGSTPISMLTPSKYTHLVNQTPPRDSHKPFMCSECGKRSNTKADVKKHFHYVHPNKEIRIIYLGDSAQNGNSSRVGDSTSGQHNKASPLNIPKVSSVHTPPSLAEVQSLHNPKGLGYIKPFKCGHCGRRSNWRWDTLKHLRERHPGLELNIIELTEQEARDSIHEYLNRDLPVLNRVSGSAPRKPSPSSTALSTKAVMVEMAQHVDSFEKDEEGRYKRFKCSACAYRSKLKTDCKRHIIRRHGARAKVIVMGLDEAKATIGLYKYKRQQSKPVIPYLQEEEETQAMQQEMMNNEVEMVQMMTPPAAPPVVGQMSPCRPAASLLPSPHPSPTSSAKQKLIGWKRWKCSMCPQLFDEKVDALKHIVVHNMKAFRCTGCLWTSNFRSAVRKHAKNRHPEGTATCKVTVKLWRFKQAADGYASQTPEKKRQMELEQIRVMEEKQMVREAEVLREKQEMAKEELLAVYCCKLCAFRSRWRSCVCRHLKSNHEILDYPKNMVKKIIRLNSSKGQEILAMSKKPISGKVSVPPRSPASGSETDSPRSLARPRNFACSICPYRAYKRKMLKFHMSCHKPQPGVKQVKCKYCPYYVNGARLLTQHMNLHLQDMKVREQEVMIGLTTPTKDYPHPVSSSPVANKRHRCEKCPYTSNSKNDYLYHKQFHRPKPTADFKCDYCDYWVTHRRLIKQHMKIHLQHQSNDLFVRPSPVPTPTKSEYSENSLIYDTVEIAAIKQRIISSKITPSISQTPIVSPMKIASSCVLGGKRGFMRKDGTYRKIHRCRHCPYLNLRLRNMKLHELMHGKRSATHPLMKCPHCDYFVGSKGLLAHHLKVHQSDYGAQFVVDRNKTDESVSEDSEVDTNAIPVQSKVDSLLEIARFKKYGCEKCPYASAKRARFQRHAELHGSRQKYKCDYCDYSVPTTILLRQHERLHYEPNQNLLAAQSILNLQFLPEMPADVALASMLTNNDAKHPVSVTHDHIDLYENTTEDTEPKKIYRCDRCPYANIRRDHLLAHLRCHMIKNTFSCPYCDYSVGKIHVLMQHVKVHFSPLPELSDWLNENGDAQRIKEVKEKDLKEAMELAKLFQNEPAKDQNGDSKNTEANTLHDGTDKTNISNDTKDMEVNGADMKESKADVDVKDTSMDESKEKVEKEEKTNIKADVQKDTEGAEKMETDNVKADGTSANGNDRNMANEKMEVDQKVVDTKDPVKHEEKMPEGYVCQYCDRDFQTSDGLVRHEMQHLIGNSYEELVIQFMGATPSKEESQSVNGESTVGGATNAEAGPSGVKAGSSGDHANEGGSAENDDSIISIQDTNGDTIILSSSSQDENEPMIISSD